QRRRALGRVRRHHDHAGRRSGDGARPRVGDRRGHGHARSVHRSACGTRPSGLFTAEHEVREPEVALAFTADVWVEELHRHLTDHGGARVRTLLVEPEGALEESYDVLVAGHRWPALTIALVADVHAHGRAVVGVHDREELASGEHLISLGV